MPLIEERDPVDFATQLAELDREAKVQAQLAAGAVRMVPLLIGGAPSCPDCRQPLPAHRLHYGICVHCKSVREKTEWVQTCSKPLRD